MGFIKKIWAIIWSHKIISLIVLAVLAGGGYYSYQKYFTGTATTRYVTSSVTKGSISLVVSGTGQVSASNQVDITSKASGEVLYLSVKAGQEVKSGALLASLDSSDALKTYRDAKTSLETAELTLQKTKEPPTELEITQAENSLIDAQESKQDAIDSLQKSYDDGFNTVANAFLDLPSIMTGMKDLLYGNDFSTSQSNIDWYANSGVSARSNDMEIYNKIMDYRADVNEAYNLALAKYNTNSTNYKSASRLSNTSTIESLIIETYDDVKLAADLVKSANNYLDLVENTMTNSLTNSSIPSKMTTHQSSLETYTSKTNSHLSNLLSIKNSIKNYQNSIISADRNINIKTLTLADLKAGADALDIRSQEISVQKAKDTLAEASSALADYSVRAPFDGVIASVSINKGDSISTGKVVASIITKQKIATVSFNEVDIAKVKVGQRANLTFDAVEDLNITGQVSEVDTVGTVSQGVVSYNVKIAFDVQDERIKSGMSVNATIIIESKNDVLLVSSSAVKTSGENSYVEILGDDSVTIERKTITTGITDDVNTEITSGLNEGEKVVTQTISSSSSKSSSTKSSSSSSNRSGVGMMMGGPPM